MAPRCGNGAMIPPVQVTSQGNPIPLTTGFGVAAPLNAALNVSFSSLPHRQWLYGTTLVRGEITLLASPGGVGKSSLTIVQMIEIATGRRLLGVKIWQPDLTALYVNAEDSTVEICRRVYAACLHHGVAESDLARLYILGADDWRTQRLSFLRADKATTFLDQNSLDFLDGLLGNLQPDVVVFDPLVALCGGGNMNDNAAMALVMRALKRLANKHCCAIYILHHTRKGGDLTNAEAIGGASAIVNLSRRAEQALPMTAEEAHQNGVLPSDRSSYFKVVSSKANLVVRSDDNTWYRLHGVLLPNAQLPWYPNGDNVQAVERVMLPLTHTVAAPIEAAVRKAIVETVDAGKIIDGKRYPYSPNIAGAANQRGLLDDAIAAAALATAGSLNGNDLSVIVPRCIKALTAEGVLVVGEIPQGRFRRGAMVSADWSKTPWSKDNKFDTPAPASPEPDENR